ncbi:MAG: GNAT family N-acetyltransferase [Spirochaetia bacterium]|nr:GNAT family N-acetyltransferase [Spirochaetia bacterium]
MKPIVIEAKDKADIDQAIDILTVSLQDDPSKVYFFPAGMDRSQHTKFMIQKIFKISQNAHRLYVCKSGQTVVGASMWFPPGYEMSYFSMLKNGLLKLPFIFGLPVTFRIIQSITISDKNKLSITGKMDYWHLFYIGVHPDHQNKGYGAQVLAPILEESDKSGIPVFLENFTDANTRFYERNGFEVKSYYRFNEDILMRNMVRQPGAVYKKIPHATKEKNQR